MPKPFNDSDLTLAEKCTIAGILKANGEEHASETNLATFSEEHVQHCLEKEILTLRQLTPKVLPRA